MGLVIPEYTAEERQPTHLPSLWRDQGAFLPVGKAKSHYLSRKANGEV